MGFIAVALFAFSAQATTYTWTGASTTSQNWDDKANWNPSTGYPSTSSDTAVFAAGSTNVVKLNFTSARTIAKLDLSAANIKLTFKLGDGVTRDNAKLTVNHTTDGALPTLILSGKNLDFTLDGVSVATPKTCKPQMGVASKFSIINGAAFSSGVFYNQAYASSKMAGNAEGGKIYIAGGSTVWMNGLHLQNGLLEIDDSTFTSDYGLRFWNDTSATTIRFKGKHPLFKTTESNGEGKAYPCASGYNVHFEFVIPEGGFTETPIQSGKSKYKFPSPDNGSSYTGYTGTYAFDVASDSPAKVAGESLTATLISWTPGFYTSSTFTKTVNLPQTTDSYAWSTTTLDVTLKGVFITATPDLTNQKWNKIDLSFAASTDASRELYVAYGATDGGTDASKWTTTSLKTLATTDTTYAYSFPTDGTIWGAENFKVVRFYIVENGVKYWSKATAWYNLSAPVFAATPTAVDAGGDAITVSGEMKDYPGDTCTLKVLTGTSSDALTTEWTELDGSVLPTSDGGKKFSLTLCETSATSPRLAPGNTYYVAVVATSDGTVTTSEVVTVTTKSATPAFSTKGATATRRTAKFTGKLSALGYNGKADVTLWVGESNSESALKQVGEAQTVTATGTQFSFEVTLDTFGKTYYYQLRATSTSAGGTATTSAKTTIGSVTTTDGTVTYSWTGNAKDGDWTNKANWTDDKDGDCLGYPSLDTSTAKFPVGTEVEFTVAADTTIGTIDLSDGGASVTFKKDEDATSAPLLKVNTSLDLSGKDNVFTLDSVRLYFPGNKNVTLGSNSTWKVVNEGAKVVVNPTGVGDTSNYGNVYNRGGKILVENCLSFECLRYYMYDAAYLLVKDATFTAKGRTAWNSTDTANPDVIRIEGANAHYTMGWENYATFAPKTPGAILNLDFVIPKDGWTNAAPLTTTSNPESVRHFGYSEKDGDRIPGTLNVNLIQDATAKSVTTKLISWPDAGISKTAVKEGSKPRNAVKFIWDNETSTGYPTTLDAELPGGRGLLLIIR